MTLVIENVSKDFLPAFIDLAHTAKAKVKTKKNKDELVAKWDKEAKEAIKAHKNGMLKSFKNAKEMHESILND
ncbi:hypothetical protein [Campylobacter sp. VTCC 70190]|uniref:hypothetical protein n=1 Tax=Campylobacter sp. VTCC 70190 TaxID=3392118 RepID=UPI00398F4277